MAPVSSGSETDPTLWTERLSSPGGVYRLCWCERTCNLPENFRVDFGSMQILGPSPLEQHRTCISGQSCILEDISFFGFDWWTTQVLVLETCSLPTLVIGWPADGLRPVLTSGTGTGVTLGSFESKPFSAAGGQYQMCWCFLSCEKPQDFHVSFGTLTVVGPSQLSQVTCTNGQVCQIHGIIGSYASSHDRVLLLSTCGTADAITIFQSGPPSHTTASGSAATWSSAPITAAGGRYRLCWCSSVASCSVASDFISDMGELILLGPSPLDQHRTCVSGQTCEFDGFLGSQLSSLNKVLLADTCGVGAVSVEIASLAVTLGVSAIVSWGSPLHIAGGVYRLCWCSGDSGGQSCYAADDFTTDVGSLTMIGVAPLQQEKTCISGLPCEIDGITGLHTSSSDQFLVLQTCGVSTIVEGFPGFGIFDETGSSGGLVSWGPISAAGGQYALCWCHHFSPGSCRALSEPFFFGKLLALQSRHWFPRPPGLPLSGIVLLLKLLLLHVSLLSVDSF